jgi:hypothetical protein
MDGRQTANESERAGISPDCSHLLTYPEQAADSQLRTGSEVDRVRPYGDCCHRRVARTVRVPTQGQCQSFATYADNRSLSALSTIECPDPPGFR